MMLTAQDASERSMCWQESLLLRIPEPQRSLCAYL
jgi:hypothetical protein